MVTEGVWNVKRKRDTEEVGSLKVTKNKKERCWSIGPRRKGMLREGQNLATTLRHSMRQQLHGHPLLTR